MVKNGFGIAACLETSHSRRRLSVRVGFVEDKVSLGQVCIGVHLCCTVAVIPPMLHSQSFMYNLCYIISAVDSFFKRTLNTQNWCCDSRCRVDVHIGRNCTG